MAKLRKFTKSDWSAWAGADENGIVVHIFYGDNYDCYMLKCTQPMAELVVRGLPAKVIIEKLLELGFEKV